MLTRRVVAAGAVVLAAVILALVLFGGGGGYTVTATFPNAGQLVPGNPVQTGGQQVGQVREIVLTDDGQVEVSFEVDARHSPLPRGTRAEIRQLSVSGLANRYVDLTVPVDMGGGDIPDGGRIEAHRTRTQVDIDQLFATLDAPTRDSLKQIIRGSADSLRGRADELNRGLAYLNPAMSTSSRLFEEITEDIPLLERTLVDSARVLTALGERRDDLSALVANARDTTRALGEDEAALAEAVERLPGFMRRANTTFVSLRGALDDVDPLTEASAPVVRRLRPFMAETRAFAAGAVPTLRDVRLALRRSGAGNDLVELTNAFPPLADIATVARQREIAPGGRAVDVGDVPGAFRQTVDALTAARPVIALGRPYTMDFLGWVDDFSTTGAGFDALGGWTRTYASVAENGMGGPPKQGQFHRCPGGADIPLPDGSNVLSEAEQRELGCREEDRAVR